MNKNKLIKEFLELNRDNKVSDCTEDLNVILRRANEHEPKMVDKILLKLFSRNYETKTER